MGDDTLYGGKGQDILDGSDGNDILYGGNGNDYLSGGLGNDWLVGGPGNDHLMGNGGSDFMFGGDGSDTYDLSKGGSGRDVILADDNDDISSQFNDLNRVDIGNVTMPRIEVKGFTWRLNVDSLADFAHRVDGADIVYRKN